jgi:hypothetical protein
MPSTNFLKELFGLSGKVAVVIGGTGELCSTMAYGMALAGAEVVLVGREAAKAERRLEWIRNDGGKAYFVSAEAGDRESINNMLDAVISARAAPTSWSTARRQLGTPFLEITDEEFHRIMNVTWPGSSAPAGVRKLLPETRHQRLDHQPRLDLGLNPLSRVFTYSASRPPSTTSPATSPASGRPRHPRQHPGPRLLPRRAKPQGARRVARRRHPPPHPGLALRQPSELIAPPCCSPPTAPARSSPAPN